jgi:TonB family protein
METGSIESTNPFVATPKERDLKSNLKDLYAGLRLPGGTAPGSEVGRGISSRQNRGGAGDSGAGADFGRRQPDFSVERPTILSDTQGVNFGPWLTAVYFRVRNNWYSVIPQVYRSGLKGVVVIVFDVRRNGSLEDLEIVRSSNFSPYDRAAISSLKLSEPLPNFPDAFKKDRLTLQFTYLYNIRL